MDEDERQLWERYRQGDQSAHEALVLQYFYLVESCANRTARIATWANRDDLKQDGVIGLMKAIKGYDPGLGVEFKYYALKFISGAIYQGPEFTRGLPQQQGKISREVRRKIDELTQSQQRVPTIEEIVEKTGYSVAQIRHAADAMGVAFAGEFPESGELSLPALAKAATQERTLMLLRALAQLDEGKQKVIHLYYLEGYSTAEIAHRLGLSTDNVTKIRQRALDDLRELLGEKREGKYDEE